MPLLAMNATMHLYLKSKRSLKETAELVNEIALPHYNRQLREGLNLGGGEYFKFSREESEVLLVCNDEDHIELFVKEKSSFPFYCYTRKGGNAILETMLALLQNAACECELGDEGA
jgi:hypothetical protein